MNKNQRIGLRAPLLAVALLAMSPADTALVAQEGAEPQSGSLLESFFNAIFPTQSETDSALMEVIENTSETEIRDAGRGAPPQRNDQRIEVLADFDEALKLSQLEQRPLLVVLGAQWCTWCRKLEQELKADEADPILKRWVVVKVDVDAAPALADELRASALPALRVLGSDRKVVSSREGYVPIVELQAWLDGSAAAADPAIQRVLYETTALNDDDLQQLIEFLGDRSAGIRLAAQKRLLGARGGASGAVVDILRTGRLAQQLSALEILRGWNAPVDTIDPWQPATLAAPAVEPLLVWLRSQAESAKVGSGQERPEHEPVHDPQALRALISRLLAESDERRRGLIAQAEGLGEALAPELRMRLANSSELTDAQRVLLRELLFRILSGPKMRLENDGVLTALASLNAETHRKAAAKTLAAATSQDEHLIDELSQDVDPLVRELSVAALQSTGALRSRDLLRRLLADKSPSVRTAVLRELSERPQAESFELLAEYVAQETDEDLLVYTAKALAQVRARTDAEKALVKLVDNPSWRVRAAALDAIGEMLQRIQPYYGAGITSGGASAEVAAAVLKATEDTDAFVVERAVALIPKLISTHTAQTLIDFLTLHPERLSVFEQEAASLAVTLEYDPLVEVALKRLESPDPAAVRGAALIISRRKPSALREHLTKMLESEDEPTRITALYASVASLDALRDQQLELALQAWQPEEMTIEPWFELPESFRALPELPASHTAPEAEDGDSPVPDAASTGSDKAPSAANAQAAAELNALDNFFGAPAQPDVAARGQVAAEGADEPAAQQTEDGATRATAENSQLALDIASALFGSAPPPPENETGNDSRAAEGNADSVPAAPVKVRPVLASQWLDQWAQAVDMNERPEWVQELRSVLDERLGSDPIKLLADEKPEIQWLATASLATGNQQLAAHIVTAPQETVGGPASAPAALDSLPDLASVLPWLPSAARVEKLRTVEVDWTVKQPAGTTRLLDAATIIDDPAIAQWIFDGATRQPLEASQLAYARRLLSRALLGARADSLAPWTDEDQLSDETALHGVTRPMPGAAAALQWLTERFEASTTATQKALLLEVASYLDHRLATHSAVGIVQQATEFDEATKIAAIIALADKSDLSVDRAVQWLEHPLPQVRLMALKRLASSGSDFASEFHVYGMALVLKHFELSPGLWLARRRLPVEELKELVAAESSAEWQVALLLTAAGEPWLEKLAAEDQSKEALMKIVTALAKAKRSDAAALAYYRRAVAELDEYFQPYQLYQMMRTLPGEAAADIRRELRAKRGDEVLGPGGGRMGSGPF